MTGSGFNMFTQPEILGTGGPDAYGYTWIDSDTAGGPTYNWIDISGVGTEVTGLADDNTVGTFPIGFDFPYYWYTVNSFYVCSNGHITFGDPNGRSHPFPPIPSSARPNNFLAPLMTDLDPTASASAKVYYWTNAAQDTCIIAYHDMPFFATAGNNTFEIILSRPDSTITFQYHTQQGAPSGGWTNNQLSVGIENISGIIGLQYNHINQPPENAIHPDLAILFSPPESTTYEAHDVAVLKMMNDVSGGFFLYNGDSIDFWGTIQNTGNQPEAGFNVGCLVRNPSNQIIYADTHHVSSLDPGETDSLVFTPSFTTSTNGTYSLLIKSLLSGDQVSANDSIFVQFKVVTYPVQLYYDEGAHTGFVWSGTNAGYGAKFVPPRYPAKINQGHFYIVNQTTGPTVTFQIMDDDGPGGSPGTIFYETNVAVNDTGWYNMNVAGENIQLMDGGFFIGCISTGTSDPSFGMDTIFPSGRQSWEYTGAWAPYRDRETDDVLIRATVDLGPGIEEAELIAGQKYVDMVASPNPFRALTAVTVPPYCKKMTIYDASGRLIRHVKVEKGIAYWNGCDDEGKKMNQGIYFGITDNENIIKLIFVK